MDVADELQRSGVSVSTDGLDRLLGAPIGTDTFCIRPGGHMDHITAQASDLIFATVYLHLHTHRHTITCYGGVHRILCTIAPVCCRRTPYESLLKSIVAEYTATYTTLVARSNTILPIPARESCSARVRWRHDLCHIRGGTGGSIH